MKSLKGKRLLVLGGGLASYNVVATTKKAGVYTVVADYYEDGAAKRIADESIVVSTVDIEALTRIIKNKNIDGVFCGPSEFNLLNTLKLCQSAGLPFYATRKQWDTCSNKASFKEMCRRYQVPCVPEYHLTEEFLKEDLEKIVYPVMVKPVDSSSSRGIAVCQNQEELISAYIEALKFSEKKQVIVEKYIENDVAFAVRYLAYNGNIYLLLANDRYVVDPIGREALISGVAVYPSKFTEKYIREVDSNVKKMFQGIGIANGAFFMQALIDPDDGNIYFHEMGLRLSGGLTYVITEPTTGINDMLMMIRSALGEDFSSPEEIEKVDPYLNNKIAISICIPLKEGIIGRVEGLETCLSRLQILEYFQYYQIGDEITRQRIGTLDQHFCRIKFLVESYEDISQKIEFIQDRLKIYDNKNEDMIFMRFDTDRLYL